MALMETQAGDDKALWQLIDKDAIRELVLCYSRAVDRKDVALLRDLYTDDATDTHGDSFDGSADEYCEFIEASLPYMPYSGHHVCNHLVSVEGDEGNGEVYALAYHVIPDQGGGAAGRKTSWRCVTSTIIAAAPMASGDSPSVSSPMI